MKREFLSFWLIVLLLMPGISVFAQDKLNAIKMVVPFLTIAPDSRSGAMGDIGVSTSADIYSMHWNPAKYAFIDGKSGIGLAYTPWLSGLVDDIHIANLTGYYRLDERQVFSASLLYSSLGKIKITNINGDIERADVKPNEFSIDAGYSIKLSDELSAAIAFRFINSNITGGYSVTNDNKAGTSFAADIAAYYLKNIRLAGKKADVSAGLNFSNLGQKMSYRSDADPDFIPMNLRLGGGTTLELDSYNKIGLFLEFNKLLVPTPPTYYLTGETKKDGTISEGGIDANNIKDGKDPNVSVPVAIFRSFADAPGGFKEELKEITVSIGAEYTYNKQFSLRTGYFHESAIKGNRKFFTVGAGFKMNIFTLDFSYLMSTVANHPLAGTLRFSLSFNIGSSKASSKSGS